MPAELGKGRVSKVSEKALLVTFDDGKGDIWIPKSVLHADSEIDADASVEDEGEVCVAAWFAEKEGLD